MSAVNEDLKPYLVDGKLDRADWLKQIRERLLVWYRQYHRHLPWRDTHDPYQIWISEIMLQQTQVATVLEYYRRFLERFPDVQALADAPESEVLKLWAGLGYYRRARQLHAASKIICEQHAGVFPDSVEAISALPGIGRYTAGAIASFAFDLPAPILEANTARLFSRLLVVKEELKSAAARSRLWKFSEELVDGIENASRTNAELASLGSSTAVSPGQVNQAVMELGSQLCTPKSPNCLICPLKELCPSYRLGVQDSIPAIAAKQPVERQAHVAIVVFKSGRFLMRQNQAGQWWEGLWDFPRTRTHCKLPEAKSGPAKGKLDSKKRQSDATKISPAILKQLEQDIWQEFRLACSIGEWLYTVKHAVTKYRINLYCMSAELNGESANTFSRNDGWRWATKAELLDKLPLTSTAQKLSRWLVERDCN